MVPRQSRYLFHQLRSDIPYILREICPQRYVFLQEEHFGNTRGVHRQQKTVIPTGRRGDRDLRLRIRREL
jgi:hypothetical protein